MDVKDLSMEQIRQLIQVFEQIDTSVNSHMENENSFESIEYCVVVKASLLFINRLREELGLELNNYLVAMQEFDMEELGEREKDEGYEDYDKIYSLLWDSCFEFIPKATYEKCGISVFSTMLDSEDITHYKYSYEEEFGEVSPDTDLNYSFAVDYLGEISTCLPVFATEFVKECERLGFYCNDITFFHSKRVGDYMNNRAVLLEILPRELRENIDTLINTIFCNEYRYYDEFSYIGLDSLGEYCCVKTSAYSAENETHVCSYVRKQYLDIAAVLLDRCLTEAEGLVLKSCEKNAVAAAM